MIATAWMDTHQAINAMNYKSPTDRHTNDNHQSAHPPYKLITPTAPRPKRGHLDTPVIASSRTYAQLRYEWSNWLNNDENGTRRGGGAGGDELGFEARAEASCNALLAQLRTARDNGFDVVAHHMTNFQVPRTSGAPDWWAGSTVALLRLVNGHLVGDGDRLFSNRVLNIMRARSTNAASG